MSQRNWERTPEHIIETRTEHIRTKNDATVKTVSADDLERIAQEYFAR